MHAGSGFSVPGINTVSLRSPPCKSLNGLRGRALLIKKWGPDVHPLIPRRIIPADNYAGRAWTDSTAREQFFKTSGGGVVRRDASLK